MFLKNSLWLLIASCSIAVGLHARLAKWEDKVPALGEDTTWLKNKTKITKGNILRAIDPHGGERTYLSGAMFNRTDNRATGFVLRDALNHRTIVHIACEKRPRLSALQEAQHLIVATFLLREAQLHSLSQQTVISQLPDRWMQTFMCDPLDKCAVCDCLHGRCPTPQPGGANVLYPHVPALQAQHKLLNAVYKYGFEKYKSEAAPRFETAGVKTPKEADFSHTEIMLIYDYNGQLPDSRTICSRFSMCKTCEPAVVQAAGSKTVQFISRWLYKDSYVAGDSNASVQKAVYNGEKIMPVKDLICNNISAKNYSGGMVIDWSTFNGKRWPLQPLDSSLVSP